MRLLRSSLSTLMVAVSLTVAIHGNSQSITFDNVPPLSGGGNTLGGIAFNLTTSQQITVEGLRASFFTTATGVATIWYRPTKINGLSATNNISVANGWINLGSSPTFTGISTSSTLPVPQTVPLPISVVMQPGDTFGFAIHWTANIIPTTNTNTPTFTDGVVTIICDATSAYTFNPGQGSFFTPRQLNGGVIYSMAALCSLPPTPGVAIANPASLFCSDSSVTLDLQGSSTGFGQTYQWQKSASISGPFIDIGSSNNDPLFVINPTETAFYRAAVTCDTVTAFSTPVEVTVVPLPIVNIGADTFYCENIPFTLLLDAGNTGSAFNWNTGASTQAISIDTAGTYSVTVTAPNTCQRSAQLVVQEYPNPLVNLGNDTFSCEGNPTFFVLNVANPGATYQWSTGSAGASTIITQPGTYSVTVTSNLGCAISDTLTITEVPKPILNIQDTVICEGQPLIFDAANPGATYLWSDNSTGQTLNVSATGIYQVTVTNAQGCSANDIASVTIHPLPVVDLGSDTAVYLGALVTLNAGNPGATYLWSTGATTQSIEVTTHGSYSVTVTDANGCEGTDDITIIGTGITTLSGLGTATLFPNPASQSLQLRIELLRGDTFYIEVFDATGRMLASEIQELSPGTHTLPLQVKALAQGTYIVRIRTADGLLGTLPFVKQ